MNKKKVAILTASGSGMGAATAKKLYEKGFIEDERIDESGFYHLEIRLPKQELERLM